ncbi:MAG: hypothetical protein QOD51_303 [Candidatus Eremiobacteraeota bacterium]|jgi:hypothetical protein|nr:hypothetical protein [Candidatus Eremiobacteraeota bacterium]
MNLLVSLAAAAALSCGAAASAAVPAGQTVDGIRCDQMEGSVLHIHQHLEIRDHGKPVRVPDDVGRPIVGQCLYWLHTHTPDGIVHIEAPGFHTFTLGNFFDVWGEPLTKTDVAGAKTKKKERVVTWVDGSRYTGDPRKIELTQHLDVTIEVGPPYAKPAPFTAWNGN